MDCMCDLDFRCENHDTASEQNYWAGFLGIKPSPADVANAYEPGDYKGRFWEGWDAA